MSYPGGKGGVYQKIINLIPPHDVYIETHLGGGSVLLNKQPAIHNIGVDIDPKVISVWEIKPEGNIELHRGDAVEFLESYQFTGKEFIYCDPPYLLETRRGGHLYDYEYSVSQHKELLKVIKTLCCSVMISGYRSDLYTESLKGWNTFSFQASTRQGIATEWVWFNYPPPEELHDYRYLGNTFRERERIKRKTTRWISRLKSMPGLERQALLAAVNAVNNDAFR